MQAADTNVLVRALVHDEGAAGQCAAAQGWLASLDAVYVPQAVQLELVWVLDRAFRFSRAEIVAALSQIADHVAISLQSPDAFLSGLDCLRDGGDFDDGVIAYEATCVGAELVTFDRKLAKRFGAKRLAVA